MADRVNLGLIPSSEAGWPVACAALKPYSGGTLHVHGNVTAFDEKQNNSVVNNTNTLSGAMGSYQISNNKTVDSCSCGDNVEKCGITNESDIKVKAPMRNVPNTSDNSSCTTLCDKGIVKTDIGDKEYPQQSKDECNSQGIHFRKSRKQSKNNEALESENAAFHFERVHSCENKCSWICGKSGLKPAWIEWSEYVANSLHYILLDLHKNEWTCTVLHVEHVKSYASHIDHMVVDIYCKPSEIHQNSKPL